MSMVWTDDRVVDARARRGFLRAAARGLVGGIAATVGAVVGRAAVGTSLVPRDERWVKAARLDELETNVPTPVTLRVTRQDGYLESVDQQVVFLMRDETSTVRAMSSSCAHLGCSVSFNRDKGQFLCPCHNGVFGIDGTVVSGPAPKPLEPLAVRVDRARVLVRV